MKKTFNILLFFIFCICFTACSDKTESTSTDTGTAVSISSQETETLSSVSINETDLSDIYDSTILNSSNVTDMPSSSDPINSSSKPNVNVSVNNETTTKKVTTTKPTTTKPKNNNFTKHEISINGLSNPVSSAKLLRAWRISNGDGSVKAEIRRFSYGSKRTATFTSQDMTKTVNYQPYYNIAVIDCAPQKIGVSDAKQILGVDKTNVHAMASKRGALVAINNESFNGHWNNDKVEHLCLGPVYRDGAIVQTKMVKQNGQANYNLVYKDGRWVENTNITSGNIQSFINDGLNFTERANPCFWDGSKRSINSAAEDNLDNTSFFGQINENKYIMMVCEKMLSSQIYDVLKSYNVNKCFQLNGGNCSYLYVEGVGNVTGTKAKTLQDKSKINVISQEFFANNGMLTGGKLGSCCDAMDIVYVK